MTGRPEAASRPRATARWILAARAALLLAALAAVVVALAVVRAPDAATTEGGPRYACPMHPEVSSDRPGQCPICHMDLEPVASSGGQETGGGAGVIRASTYLGYDIPRRRGVGPDSLSPAWVDESGEVNAVVYDDELEGLAAEARAVFRSSGPARPETAVRAVPDSRTRWDESTSKMRFRIDRDTAGPDARVPAGSVGWVHLVDRGREQPLIADSAVLHDGSGPYVLVASEGALRMRRVRLGKVFGDMAFVLGGLEPRERVLTRSTFFVDAERRLSGRPSIGVVP
jgi:hypothetical protein